MCWNICYGNRLGYSSINTVRSALSALLSLGYTYSLGEYRLMKGVFNQRPALPRYQHIWDVNSVLEYLALLNPVNVLSFYTLTLKCVMLLCLLSGQRVQTLQQICLKDCAVTDGVLRIKHSSILKTTKPGNHLDDIVLPAYTNDNCLCIINTFSEYVNRTKELRQRGSKRLLLNDKEFCFSLIGLNSIFSTLPQSRYTSRAVSTPRVRYVGLVSIFVYCLFGASTLSDQRRDFISSRPIKLQRKVKIFKNLKI